MNLQIALIVIGVIVIAAIYLISKWSDKANQSPSKSFDDFQVEDDRSPSISVLDNQMEEDKLAMDMQMYDSDDMAGVTQEKHEEDEEDIVESSDSDVDLNDEFEMEQEISDGGDNLESQEFQEPQELSGERNEQSIDSIEPGFPSREMDNESEKEIFNEKLIEDLIGETADQPVKSQDQYDVLELSDQVNVSDYQSAAEAFDNIPDVEESDQQEDIKSEAGSETMGEIISELDDDTSPLLSANNWTLETVSEIETEVTEQELLDDSSEDVEIIWDELILVNDQETSHENNIEQNEGLGLVGDDVAETLEPEEISKTEDESDVMESRHADTAPIIFKADGSGRQIDQDKIEPSLTKNTLGETSLVSETLVPDSETEYANSEDAKTASMVPLHQPHGEYKYTGVEGFDKVSQIDYWVKIHGDRDIGRETVLAQYREAKSALNKPNSLFGLKVPEKTWCDLEFESEETRFADIVVTIQLADSNGPITETELSRFAQLVAKLSEGTGRGFNFMASIENAQSQAEAISDFVKYYDTVFVVNIKPEHDEYFDGAAIHRFASQLALDQGENNFYVRNKLVGKRKVCLYSMANMSDTGQFDFDDMKNLKTRGVTFFTKPAVNRTPGAVFAEMVDTAKAFASRIKGEVIAPNFEDLSQDDVDEIRLSIEKVAEDMERNGMPAGSDEAMRIF